MNLPDSKANKYVHSFYPDMCAGLALQYTQIEDICNAATMRKTIITHSLRELHNGSEVCSESMTEPEDSVWKVALYEATQISATNRHGNTREMERKWMAAVCFEVTTLIRMHAANKWNRANRNEKLLFNLSHFHSNFAIVFVSKSLPSKGVKYH